MLTAAALALAAVAATCWALWPAAGIAHRASRSPSGIAQPLGSCPAASTAVAALSVSGPPALPILAGCAHLSITHVTVARVGPEVVVVGRGYRLALAPPAGHPLRPGTYPAVRAAFRGRYAGVELTRGNVGCNSVLGSFTVTELRQTKIAVLGLRATFTFTCDGSAPVAGRVQVGR